MESEEAIASADRPSIGFPLGLALLFVLLFCMSAFLACCLHWDKIRSFILPFSDHDEYDDGPADDIQINIDDNLPQKSSPLHMISKQNQGESLLVSMPGDQLPKFVAMACPRKPSTVEKLPVTVHNIPT
ncbi:Hydroxyproline-rich glycoprotein family protein [Melia azedarach]|uniref:Hydroxyproline-rich glycoprotein family protein n=1 Tax=Melia azedarach TaxID=155640 RepID=A0ACC1WRL8_MELAZ|nr:Hydroxyproline-rich glycoprotein family protein [Melia azedarach]